MEIEVSDNPFDSDPVDISNVPVIVTLTLVCIIIIVIEIVFFSCLFYSWVILSLLMQVMRRKAVGCVSYRLPRIPRGGRVML